MEEKGNNDYLGNIWGWRWSIISLIFILIVLAIMFGRYQYLVATDNYPVKQDTIQVDED
ncbi:MAG: hypothetical protein R3275_10215 [Saprospiraceae bacterium]|nr:hypothetical protein [Saprospiraceae bacterium]